MGILNKEELKRQIKEGKGCVWGGDIFSLGLVFVMTLNNKISGRLNGSSA